MRTQDWIKCVAHIIIGMIYIDAMNVHQACVDDDDIDRDPHDCLTKLSKEMIDNNIDVRSSRNVRNAKRKAARHASEIGSPNLTPTKRKNNSGFSMQGCCRTIGCEKKSTVVCRACTQAGDMKPFHICNTNSGRKCWEDHMATMHIPEPIDFH